MDQLVAFWGKTFKVEDGHVGAPPFKPVLHHLLDVAAVALAYLVAHPAEAARHAKAYDLSAEAYAQLAAFCTGLHDLGKFTRNFQIKAPELWPKAALGAKPTSMIPGPAHWQATARLLSTPPIEAAFLRLAPQLGLGLPIRCFRCAIVMGVLGRVHTGEAPKVSRGSLMEADSLKYRALLSYSHRDTTWGKWLHAALEGYSVDKDLIGRETLAGPVPKTLRPIFRDREDFAAGPRRRRSVAQRLA